MRIILLCILYLHLAYFNLIAQSLTGTASYYANKFNGKRAANGKIFNNNGLTCACNKLPLGTIVIVTNLSNGKSITVTVTDRLAARNRRLVDLTQYAAKQLGFYNKGLTKVSIQVVSKKKEKLTLNPIIIDTLEVIPTVSDSSL
jgi:rare lipoprotein A